VGVAKERAPDCNEVDVAKEREPQTVIKEAWIRRESPRLS